VPEHKTHGTVNYVAIWFVLLVLFAVSVAAAYLGASRTSMVLVFTVAAAKALLVLSYYMHLRFEPRWIVVLLLGAFSCGAILFFGLIPDIARIHGG
jgi:cytochrome c oxidase subunit 4